MSAELPVQVGGTIQQAGQSTRTASCETTANNVRVYVTYQEEHLRESILQLQYQCASLLLSVTMATCSCCLRDI